MKASELIKELLEAIEKFGDLDVFSRADYEVVSGVDLISSETPNSEGVQWITIE